MGELVCVELQALEPSRAEVIKNTFLPMADMVEQFEARFNEIVSKEIAPEVCAAAKRLRLDIVKIRTATEKLRKAEKEEYLRAGKAIDGVANVLKWAVEQKEDRLREIETHYEEIERQKVEALQQARVDAIAPYLEGAAERDFRAMPEDVWQAYFDARKKDHEDTIAAQAKAEADRVAKEKADAEERERVKAENARLKAEADAREKAEVEQRAKEAAERKAIEEQHRKEREAAEAKARAEKEAADKAHREELARLAKIKAEEDARIHAARKAEAEAKAKVDAELARIKEIERKAIADAAAKAEADARRGDAAKWEAMVAGINALAKPQSWQSESSAATFAQVAELLGKVVKFIEQKTGAR